jgi:precorrin-2 dehydrogenase/sirohydrochlorin ferrochelatase
MAPNPGFQLSLDVKGRTCVVLGGDDEAAEKVQRLLQAGAKVTVVHPTLNDTLRKLAATAKIIHRPRRFRETDAQGVMLVLNTLREDPAFSKSVYELAQKERFLVCSSDQPEASNCLMPAVISSGHLRIAISTSGVAPALSSRLREELGRLFDTEDFRAFVEWLAKLREETQETEREMDHRHALLREAAAGFKVTGCLEYPRAWSEKRGGA